MDSARTAQTAPGGLVLNREITLPVGTLQLAWDETDWQLDDLCEFGTRQYASRGFLIISRVLGRHLPSSPLVMRNAIKDLARLVPAALPGPALFVGMAETAITLGQGVYEACLDRIGFADSIFLHSTRQLTGNPLLATFSEPHSHASAHAVHRPKDAALINTLSDVRSIVLVDDEVTTGQTFVNLAVALRLHLPALERIDVVSLTDWSGDSAYLARMPLPACSAALLSGRLDWTSGSGRNPCTPKATAQNALGRFRERANLGRQGVRGRPFDVSTFRSRLAPLGTEPLHVIGTGELHFPAFLLAELLAAEGLDVLVQATTRSPIRLGASISQALEVADPYGAGVPNFLYNLDQTRNRRRIVCAETLPRSSFDDLLRPGDVGLLDMGTCT